MPVLRLPSVGTCNLYSADFFHDGQQGCVCGDGGSILRTTDSGQSWSIQFQNTETTLGAVQFVDDKRGWATVLGSLALTDETGHPLTDSNGKILTEARQGSILHTDNGGIDWNVQSLPGHVTNLGCFAMAADGLRGWFGSQSNLVTTLNGGKLWSAVSKEMQFFVTIPTAIAVVPGGKEIYVADVDGTIKHLSQDTPPQLISVIQTNDPNGRFNSLAWSAKSNLLWAVGLNGEIETYSPGTSTWATLLSGVPNELTSIQITEDGKRGFICGRDGIILRTEDGRNWHKQISGIEDDLYALKMMPDGMKSWAVGRKGTVLYTENGGVEWRPLTIGTRAWLNSTYIAADGVHQWAAGWGGLMLISSDAGKTWKESPTGSDNVLTCVSMLDDSKTGWAVGREGTVLKTNDGGINWAKQDFKGDDWLDCVQFMPDGLQGWAVGRARRIFSTQDGGKTWSIRELTGPDLTELKAIQMLDEKHGCAVGNSGILIKTDDGWTTWKELRLANGWLNAIQLLPDGRGWAVGSDGVIMSTTNGGDSWNSLASPVNSELFSITVDSTGTHGLISGAGGALLTTDDGKTWKAEDLGTKAQLLSVSASKDQKSVLIGGSGGTLLNANGKGGWQQRLRYHRWPAPIYYAVLILGLIIPLLYTFWVSGEPVKAGESIADAYVSDAVLTEKEATGTLLGAIAAGLAAYIENPNTRSPLVIGVNGKWGSGKSSLMNILRSRLRQRGFQTASFNAWHHQKEAHLFNSVMGALRSNALPSLWSLRGLMVRGKLLYVRCRRMWFRLLLAFASIVFICRVVSDAHFSPETILSWSDASSVLKSLALPVAAIPILALWKVFTAFGMEPSKLGELVNGPNVEKARTASGLREQFAQEFAEVIQALKPLNLVIFIDDLDRCKPDQMMSMLEVVNFLANCGEGCYIVLGMDKNVVLECLQEKIPGLSPMLKPSKRLTAAEHWLEKLVQLPLRVPDLSEKELRSIYQRAQENESVSVPSPPPVSRLEGLLRNFPAWFRIVPYSFFVLTVIVMVGYGALSLAQRFHYHQSEEKAPDWLSKVELSGKVDKYDVSLQLYPTDEATSPSPALTTTKAANPESQQTTNAVSTPALPAAGTDITGEVFVDSGQRDLGKSAWIFVGVTLLLILLVTVVILSIRDFTAFEDSKNFRDTLDEFRLCILKACPTPRAVKKLLNRIRLYAMLLRYWPSEQDESGDADLAKIPEQHEANLVIFGILQELDPSLLRKALENEDEPKIDLPVELQSFEGRAIEALKALRNAMKNREFKRLLQVIDLSA